MRCEFLKSKAMLMIYLVITMTVCFSFSISADDLNACCEKTTAEAGSQYCAYTLESNCDENYQKAYATCEQTEYCEVGCCVSDQGGCSKNVAKATCNALEGYTWDESANCDIAECDKGCCVVAESECVYTTDTACTNIMENFPDLEKDFRDVTDENACTNVCAAADVGCCVEENSCIWGTRAECNYAEIDPESGYGFYENVYCSNDNFLCGCEEEFIQECDGEDGYWYDSCGNREAKVIDCDYAAGNYCSKDGDEVYCKSTSCTVSLPLGETDARQQHDNVLFTERTTFYNGESWCMYESPAGNYLDWPGSQHYRVMCLMGEIVLEPCRDYREEVCIQYPIQDKTTNSYVGSYGMSDKRSAACIDNSIYDASLNVNITTVPKGGQFWSDDGSLTEQCAAASVTCKVVEEKESVLGTWNVVAGQDCLEVNWTVSTAKYCKSRGDCGNDYNLLGEYTDSGFYMNGPENIHTKLKQLYYMADEQAFADTLNEVDIILASFGIDKYYDLTAYHDDLDDKVDYLYTLRSELPDAVVESWGNYGAYGGLIGVAEYLDEVQQDPAALGYSTLQSTVFFTLAIPAAIYVLVGLIYAAAAGATTAATVTLASTLAAITPGAGAGGPITLIIFILAAAVLTILSFTGGSEELHDITSSCEIWQPPYGGDMCYLCDEPVTEGGLALTYIDESGNEQIMKGYECTEYKCHSLGQNCNFISENEGTDRAKCYNEYPNDVNEPSIEIWTELLDDQGLEWSTLGDFGYEITTEVDPYKKIVFGIIATDEATTADGITTKAPTQCKIDTELKETYEEMNEYMPDSYYDFNHNSSRILYEPNTDYTFYIRCTDPAGNSNTAAYSIRLHTSDGIDLEPPVFVETEIADYSYIANNIETYELKYYLDEPVSECKWDYEDTDFEFMGYYSVCDAVDTGATQAEYTSTSCLAALNVTFGENTYYLRCQDISGNMNQDSFVFHLTGTDTLDITQTAPEGVLYENDVTLQVKTDNGAEDGIATCNYKLDTQSSYSIFAETKAKVHQQKLHDLATGDYIYNIQCVDEAGNVNQTSIEFTVDVDEEAPYITEIYTKNNYLYITTNENTDCEYSTESFIFNEGTTMSGSMQLEHNLPISEETYYIICQDEFENEMVETIVHL